MSLYGNHKMCHMRINKRRNRNELKRRRWSEDVRRRGEQEVVRVRSEADTRRWQQEMNNFLEKLGGCKQICYHLSL